jgi:hypothetical protein
MVKLHAHLLALDQGAAEVVRAAGCAHCGGPLHAAHFGRKTRGLDDEAVAAGQYDVRLSFCCGREGCRARATPPSVRFSKRRVFASLAVLMLSLAGSSNRGTAKLLGVQTRPQSPSWHTRSRWLSWWRSGLLSTPWFQALCANFATPPKMVQSPDSLLAPFIGELEERFTRVLVWLAPLTTDSVAPEQSRIAMAR